MLAPQLPLPIPMPVARGEPGAGFPYPWSVYRWLDGEPASRAPIDDLPGFASALAGFLNALGRVDATGGPAPGEHNFYRGGPLSTYEEEALQAIDALGDEVPADAVRRGVGRRDEHLVGPRARCGSTATSPSGTCSSATGGWRAVIDFGSSGVGDPACDTVIAWTFLSGPSRAAFRAALDVDRAPGRAAAAGRCGRR